MCSQRHIKQRAQPSGAPPTARLSKCTISSVTRAWSGMTTLKPQQRSTHVLEHAQTHHGIPLHSKGASSKHAAPQNSWRATNLSSIKMHHIERHTGREWRIHPHTHRNTPHAYFGPTETPPWIPLHSKRAHNIRHLRERAHLSLIKMHHVAFLLA